jgi:hypothetical protein
MSIRRHWRALSWALAGLIAGSLLAPALANATSTASQTGHVVIPNRQSVLASEVCSGTCSATIRACGTLGGAIAQGDGDVTITDANGIVYWKADPDPNSGSGINRMSDVFTPGVLFQTNLTIIVSGTTVRYIVYGNRFLCAGR